MRRLFHQNKAVAALEMALVFPTFLLFIFGLFAVYSLVTTRRAMDFGIERALRYAAVNGGGGTAGTAALQGIYNTAATAISGPVGSASTFDVGVNGATPSGTSQTFKASDTVTIQITYAWASPSAVMWTGSSLFPGITLVSSASMRIVN